jgi:hypothetical protein
MRGRFKGGYGGCKASLRFCALEGSTDATEITLVPGEDMRETRQQRAHSPSTQAMVFIGWALRTWTCPMNFVDDKHDRG